MLEYLFDELKSIEDKEGLEQALQDLIARFKEKNMKGYVYIIYVGNGLYKIGKTGYLERRWNELKEERVVRLIKAENISDVEGQLHRLFGNKRQTASQELFRLNDQDLLAIHTFPDEWEDDKLF